MSAYFDMAAANPILKEYYEGQRLFDLIYKNNPLLALMPKKPTLNGKVYPIPVIQSPGQGRAAPFNYAQQNQTAPITQSYMVPTRTNYAVATIQNQTILAAANDRGAFIDAIRLNVDTAMQNIVNNLAWGLYRSGTGTMGQIGTITNGVITLADINTATYFDVGMTLQANVADGGASPVAAVGYVVAVDTSLGTLTVSATGQGGTAGTPPGWLANYFLLVQGDLNAQLVGVAGWIPSTAPASNDNFFGVNRSTAPSKLAGIRYSGTSLSIEEALTNAERNIAQQGGMVDHIFVNYASFSALANAMVGKATTSMTYGPMGIGFNTLEINGSNNRIKVIADRNCPTQTAYLLQMNTWEFASMGEAPQILTYEDGNKFYRLPNADAVELRIASYAVSVCQAAGYNGVVSLSQ